VLDRVAVTKPTLTIKLYDRRFDEMSLDEVEKISI
jgi:hypothetical protein